MIEEKERQTDSLLNRFNLWRKESLINEENVYLRGFGSFIVKKRAAKAARDILKNTTIIVPEHKIPAFKPAKSFASAVRNQK